LRGHDCGVDGNSAAGTFVECYWRQSPMRRTLLLVALVAGCDRHAAVRAATVGSTITVPAARATPSAPSATHTAGGVSCGELGCAQFDSPGEAFLAAVAGDARVVAIGEAHAQKGTTAPSAAKTVHRGTVAAARWRVAGR
jgi:hypothetical protein